MKEKHENSEKVIFYVLLCLLLVAIPVLFKKNAVNNDTIYEKMQKLSTQSSQSPAQSLDDYQDIEDLRQKEQTARALSSVISKRNIFTQEVHDKSVEAVTGDRLVLQVSEIGFKPLGIEYRGKVFFKDDNDMVAQINVDKKSYLVKKGTRFAIYQVRELNGKLIHFANLT